MKPIAVLVVDDDPLVRSGLRFMLGGRDDLVVVAEAEDGAEAVSAVDKHDVDVVLMDVRMPGMNGLEATRIMCQQPDAPPVVILTTFSEDELVLASLAAGAVGFLVKDSAPTEIVRAIKAVAAGDGILSPGVTRTVLSALGNGGGRAVTDRAGADRAPTARRDAARARLMGLSVREREIAVRVGHGDSNADISARLYLSVPTVKAHMSHILEKTGTSNRVQLAILVHDANLEEEVAEVKC